MCVNKWLKGVGQLKVLEVKRVCHNTLTRMCQVWLPPKKGVTAISPKSGVGQGSTSLTYQSLNDEEESARHGLCRITFPNPP